MNSLNRTPDVTTCSLWHRGPLADGSRCADSLNAYIAEHEHVIANLEAALLAVMDTSGLEVEQVDIAVRLDGLAALMTKAVEDSSRCSQNQENCQQRFSALEKEHAEAFDRYQTIVEEIESKQGRAVQMRHHHKRRRSEVAGALPLLLQSLERPPTGTPRELPTTPRD